MVPHLKITNRCIACDNCAILCPESSILKTQNTYTIETWSCTLCHICVEVCPVNAIKFIDDNAPTPQGKGS